MLFPKNGCDFGLLTGLVVVAGIVVVVVVVVMVGDNGSSLNVPVVPPVGLGSA